MAASPHRMLSPFFFGSNTTTYSQQTNSDRITSDSQRAMSEGSLQFSSEASAGLVDSAVQTDHIPEQATQTTQTESPAKVMATQTEATMELTSLSEGFISPGSISCGMSEPSPRSSGKPPVVPIRERQMAPFGGLGSRRRYVRQDSSSSTRSTCSDSSSEASLSRVDFVQTPAICRLKSLMITLRAWVLPKIENSDCCCPKHLAICLARHAMQELEGCACDTNWTSFSGWQCRRCQCANIEVEDRICTYCGLNNVE
jgi:hypothetical protein